MTFGGDKRDRSNVLFYATCNGASISDPDSVNFAFDPESWVYDKVTSESTAKDIISARISFVARAADINVTPLTSRMYDERLLYSWDSRFAWRRLLFLCRDPKTVTHFFSTNATLQSDRQIVVLLSGFRISYWSVHDYKRRRSWQIHRRQTSVERWRDKFRTRASALLSRTRTYDSLTNQRRRRS